MPAVERRKRSTSPTPIPRKFRITDVPVGTYDVGTLLTERAANRVTVTASQTMNVTPAVP